MYKNILSDIDRYDQMTGFYYKSVTDEENKSRFGVKIRVIYANNNKFEIENFEW